MNRLVARAAAVLLSCAVIVAFAPFAGAEPNAAQAELPKEKLVIVTADGVAHPFSVEMAVTPGQQTTGLMFRTTVPADGGMLFDWGQPRDSAMWMRNTVASLDMLFINPDGSIRHIAENTTPESMAIIPSGGDVRATLELAAGTAARLNIKVGDRVQQRVFGNAS